MGALGRTARRPGAAFAAVLLLTTATALAPQAAQAARSITLSTTSTTVVEGNSGKKDVTINFKRPVHERARPLEYSPKPWLFRPSLMLAGASSQALWTGPPDAPGQLTATAADSSVRLSWKAQPGQRIVAWIYRYTSGSTEKSVTITDRSATTVLVKGLTNGAVYRFQLRAIGQGGSSAWSNQVMVTPAIQVPASPVGLSGETADGETTLTWSNPGDGTITGWQFRQIDRQFGWSGASWINIDGSDKDTTRHTVTGLTNGETYRFQIRAVNPAGGSEASKEIKLTPPGAPCRISMRNITVAGSGLTFGLMIPANCGPITKIQYQVKPTSQSWAGVNWVALSNPALQAFQDSSSSQTPTGFEFVPVSGRGWHNIRLRAGYENQYGPVSTSAWMWVGSPDAPTRLTATPADQSALLKWRAARYGQRVTAWEYRYKVGAGAYGSAVTIADANATQVIVTGLNNGDIHYFQLRANGDKPSQWSGEVAVTPVESKSVDLTVSPGDAEAMLSWTNPGNNAITKWQVRYKAGSLSYGNWADISNSNASTRGYTAKGLTNGTEYTFMVRGLIPAGAVVISGEETVTPGPPCKIGSTPRLFPVGLSGQHFGISISLNIPANCGLITNVQYQVKSSTQAWSDVAWVQMMKEELREFANSGSSVTPSATEDISTTGQGVRQLRVRALNGQAAGPASDAVRVWHSKPNKPSGLVATAGNESVTLSWSAQPNQDILGWTYRYKAGDGAYGEVVSVSGGETTTVTVSGLTGGTVYTFELKAERAGFLSLSDPSVVTATPWVLTVPAKPTGLGYTAAHKQVTLSWNNLNDASITKWQIQRKAGAGSFGSWTDIVNSDASTTSHTVSGLANGTTYTFKLRAVNEVGDGTESDEVTVTPNVAPCQIAIERAGSFFGNTIRFNLRIPADCGAITNVQHRLKSADQSWSDVEWTQVSKAVLRQFADSSMQRVPTAVETVDGITIQGRLNLQVRALNASAASQPSETVSVWMGAPEKPSGLTASVAGNSVTLTWSPQLEQNIKGWLYRYKVGGGNYFPLVILGEDEAITTVTIPDLAVGQLHTFQIQSLGSGFSEWSSEVTATPERPFPSAPADLVAVAGEREVMLSWTDPKDANITGWQLQRREGTGGYGEWSDIRGSGPSTIRHTVTRLTKGTAYAFKVRAVSERGHGMASDEVAVVLSAPCRIAVRDLQGGSTGLSFGLAIPANCGPITRVQYQTRAADQDWDDQPWVTVNNPDLLQFADSSMEYLPRGREQLALPAAQGLIDIRVRASNGSIIGPVSDPASIWVGAPNAPSHLTATPDIASVTLSWSEQPNQGIFAWEYRYKKGPEGVYGSPVTVDGGTITTFTVSGLSGGVTHTFQLRAVGFAESAWSEEVAASPRAPQSLPNTPNNLAAQAGDRKVVLTWSESSDLSIQKLQVQQRLSGAIYGEWMDIPSSNASTVTHQIGGLANGQVYFFRVRAVNAVGGSAASNEVRAMPTRPQLPAKPTGFGRKVGDGQVTLMWDDPQNDSIIRWQYRMNVDSGGFGNWVTIPGSSSSTKSATITGIQKGSVYVFEVRAVNGTGAGTASDSLKITVPAKPTGVKFAIFGRQSKLVWDDPENDSILQWQYRQKAGSAAFGEWTVVSGATADTTSATLSGLQEGTTYTFELRAVNGFGSSSASDQVTTVPVTLSHFLVETNSNQAKLYWGNPRDAGITRWEYQVKEDKGNYGSWVTISGSNANTTTATISGLDTEKTHYVKLRAANQFSTGSASGEKSIVFAQAPCKVSLIVDTQLSNFPSAGQNRVLFAYRVPIGCGKITEFQYQVLYPGESWHDSRWTTISLPLPTDPDAVATPSRNLVIRAGYTAFRGRAVNGNAPGPYFLTRDRDTPTDLSKPLRGVTAIVPNESGTIVLTWDPVPFSVTYWEIHIKKGRFRWIQGNVGLRLALEDDYTCSWDCAFENKKFTTLNTAYAEPRFTFSNLENNVEYSFRVRPIKGRGAPFSEPVIAIPSEAVPPLVLPSAPSELAGIPSSGQVTLTWDENGDAYIDRRQVQWKAADSDWNEWTDISDIPPSRTQTALRHIVTGLTNGTAYHFRVRAVNQSGSGDASEEVIVTPNPEPCRISPGGVSTSIDSLVFDLAIPPRCGPITNVQYQIKTSTQEWSDVTWKSVTQPGLRSFDDSAVEIHTGASERVALTAGNQGRFDIRVRAINTQSIGPASDPVSVFVSKPGVPTGLAAAPDDSSVTLTWDLPSDQIVNGREYRYKVGSGRYGDPVKVAGSRTTTVTIEGLTNDTEHSFQLRAEGFGTSDWSTAVTATPVRKAQPPAAPSGLFARLTKGRFILYWDNPQDPSIRRWETRTRVVGQVGSTSPFEPLRDLVVGDKVISFTSLDLSRIDGTDLGVAIRAVNDDGNGESAEVVIRISSADPSPGLVLSTSSLDINAGDSASYAIVLNTQPAGGWAFRTGVAVTAVDQSLVPKPSALS